MRRAARLERLGVTGSRGPGADRSVAAGLFVQRLALGPSRRTSTFSNNPGPQGSRAAAPRGPSSGPRRTPCDDRPSSIASAIARSQSSGARVIAVSGRTSRPERLRTERPSSSIVQSRMCSPRAQVSMIRTWAGPPLTSSETSRSSRRTPSGLSMRTVPTAMQRIVNSRPCVLLWVKGQTHVPWLGTRVPRRVRKKGPSRQLAGRPACPSSEVDAGGGGASATGARGTALPFEEAAT